MVLLCDPNNNCNSHILLKIKTTPMKCNVRELAHLSDQPCVIEGRLNYKKVSNNSYRNQAVFKERWFRLINNYLFYFKISEMGKFDTKTPAGVFVMENSSIQMEHGENTIPFSFSISFIDEPEKRHVFAARAEDNVVQWVMKLRECSYEYLRNRLYTLQSKIYSITGKDPLLLVPRNEGACLWAPGVPFSTAPACTVNTTSFSCHLHTNGFSLERSHSDMLTHKHLHHTKQTTFYTDHVTNKVTNSTDKVTDSNNKVTDSTNKVTDSSHKVMDSTVPKDFNHVFALGRSKTSTLFHDGVVSGGIFDNRPAFSRAAPSPPVRKKLSPNARTLERCDDVTQFTAHGRLLGTSGILDGVPVPPRRKQSTKNLEFYDAETGDECKSKSSDDLITF